MSVSKIARSAITACVLVSLVGACAGRSPAPVAVTQPQDASMDCAAIQTEVTTNNGKLKDLGRESGNKVAQNVAAGVAGLVIWPLWFAMDFQGAADKETAALQSRQTYLGTLATQRGCAKPVDALPAQSPTDAAPAQPPADVTPQPQSGI